MIEAVLINEPAIDFNALLSLSHSALGYNIASAADASHRKMADAEKFLSCLASLKDETAPTVTPNLLAHVSFSVLVIAESLDLLDILEIAAAMPFVRAEMTTGSHDLAVVTGTLSQWRDAVASGAQESTTSNVRIFFSKVLLLFDRAGLANVWNEFNKRSAPDRSGFYLEQKHV